MSEQRCESLRFQRERQGPQSLLQWRVFWMWIFPWFGLLGFFSVGLLGLVGAGCGHQVCDTDRDCGSGSFCRSNRCREGCRYTVECPRGQLCQANQCVLAQKDEDGDGFPAPLDCDDQDRQVNPGVAEVCGNKKDDNCDGTLDEKECREVACTPGEERDCYDGKEKTLSFPGTSCKKGRQVCTSEGSWGDCQGQILPSREVCDNIDSDCDGSVDEGEDGKALTQACYTGEQGLRGRGLCVEGRQICTKGKWGKCKGEVGPKKEICNGEDDDCDGNLDNVEKRGESCKTGRPGVCSDGELRCDVDAKKLICLPKKDAVKEICGDGLDNDCNGQIDNRCPFVGLRLGSFSSFPHTVAISEDWVVVGLRNTSKVVLVDRRKEPLQSKELSIGEVPHGIVALGKFFFVVTEQSLFRVEPGALKLVPWVRFSKGGHAGDLALLGGRLFHRYSRAGTGGMEQGVCVTEPSTKTTSCWQTKETYKRVGFGVAPLGIYGLFATEQGIHFFDTLTQQEDLNQRLKKFDAVEALDYDENTKLLVASEPTKRQVHLIRPIGGKNLATLLWKDADGTAKKPGRVAVADGLAYVGQSDGNAVSVIDLQAKKVVRSIEVGLGPLGLAVSPVSSEGRTVWVTCPGDNSIWYFSAKP